MGEWKKSENTMGKFELATGKWFGDEREDKGLQTVEDARFYDISASFDSFSNAGKDLIIQYQAKYEKDNPEFKGEWIAKRISNPEYEDDDAVYKYDDFGFVGIDLWQVKASTIFDNIIITDDVAEADAFAAKWKALNKVELEQKAKSDDAKKEEDKKKEDEDKDDDDDDDEKGSEEM